MSLSRFAIISPTKNGKVSQLLVNSFKKFGIEISRLVPREEAILVSNANHNSWLFNHKGEIPQIGLVRGVGSKIPSKIFFRLDWMRICEECGVELVNSRECLELATNKMLTSHKLALTHIPTPQTIMAESLEKALDAFFELDQDIVLKPLYGARGRGIIRINDINTAQVIFQQMELNNEIYYLQKFMFHNHEDIRMFVLGDQVLCGMKRKSDSWLTNLAQGGTAYSYNVPEEYKEIAIKSAKAVKGEIIGVDLMETLNGPMVIEVNAVPGYLGLQSVSKFNISDEIVSYLTNRNKK